MPPKGKGRQPVSFPAFFLKWGERVGWQVPDFHLQVCDFLEWQRERKVLKVFRGGSKSTLLGRYIPWRLRGDSDYRFLNMSATAPDATKISVDAQFVIDQHPWCKNLRSTRRGQWKERRWFVEGSTDARNPNVAAFGVLSNVTSSRADEAIFDDVEVPNTIATPPLRAKLRTKMSELTHILVPGGSKLYVGTDHCVDSIYKEQIEDGADHLVIPLFAKMVLHTQDQKQPTTDFMFDWRLQQEADLYVVVGGKLLDPKQYQVHGVRDYRGGFVRLPFRPMEGTVIELYSGNTWPEYFTRAAIRFKRNECKTINEWLSQYQLLARSLKDVRLNPERLIEYPGEPEIRQVNGQVTLWINGVQMITVAAHWDCSLGKVHSDANAFSVVFSDMNGYLYWHVAEDVRGEIDSQCLEIIKIVRRLKLPAVTVETNGPGGHVPTILRGALQRAGVRCAVKESWKHTQKNTRILNAFETPLSGLYLYAHSSVKHGPAAKQMREWDPMLLEQPDDYLDSGAGAIADTPVRIGLDPDGARTVGEFTDWRQGTGTADLAMDI
ncbi:MAG TPA: transcriptional regulator [Geobacter sp.]|nr:transcriptional regulator [Geobacter sp.]